MLKRITSALGLLGISLSAFAGAPGNNMVIPSGVVLTAPDSGSGWSFGIEGLYVQPTGSNFQYAQINDNAIPNTSHNQLVNNSYQWGGSADLVYRFDGNSRDVTLDYTHLSTDDSDTSHVSGAETFNQAFIFGGNPVALAPDTAKGYVDNDYNEVNLTFGQQLIVGDRLVLHPFGGVIYADIEQDDKVTYSASTVVPNSGTGKIDSDFQGAGPRAGMDVRVLTGSGISIVGTIAGSLLVGDTDAHESVSPAAVLLSAPVEWNNDESVHVVPELDARVGLDYTPHKFFPEASMAFQIGYEVVHYFNVTNLDSWDTTIVNSVNNFGSFGYQGPYLRLQLNVA
jgi:hypothetical protein